MHRRPTAFLSMVLLLLISPGCAEKKEAPAAGRGPGGPKQAVEVAPVARRDLRETLTLVGSLAANESAVIRPEIAGVVRGVFFDEGQSVNKAQVLMKIDDAELRAQYAQVEARHNLAELNAARLENLFETRMIPQSDFDRARSELAAARAELEVLKLRLERTEVKAPFDGVVGARTISPGDFATTSTALTTINDLSRLKVSFQIPERYLGKVRADTEFFLRFKANEAAEEIPGKVYFVSSVIDRTTRASEIKGYLSRAPAALKPGMFANVELTLEVRPGALTVPEGAILTTASGPQIILVREGKAGKEAVFMPVQIGLRTMGFAEIAALEGEIREQEQVVAAGVGALTLYPGIQLDPRPLREEFR